MSGSQENVVYASEREIVFAIKRKAAIVSLAEGAQILDAELLNDEGTLCLLRVLESNAAIEAGTYLSHKFKVVKSGAIDQRDLKKVWCKVAGSEHLELCEVTRRVGTVMDVQNTPLELGFNTLFLPCKQPIVLSKRPVRMVLGVPHLCWRGRKDSQEIPYVVVLVSERSAKEGEHTETAKYLASLGRVEKIQQDIEPAYEVWVDSRMVV